MCDDRFTPTPCKFSEYWFRIRKEATLTYTQITLPIHVYIYAEPQLNYANVILAVALLKDSLWLELNYKLASVINHFETLHQEHAKNLMYPIYHFNQLFLNRGESLQVEFNHKVSSYVALW